MSGIVVYHNPKCSKSRGAVEILRERGVAFETIEYLKTPPDRETLERLLDLLGGTPADLVRRDDRFRELGLDAREVETREQVVSLLLEHPELLQRPVVVRGERAILARPSERVLEIL